MSTYPPVSVVTWGHYACFTRPENKVERVSYDVMTPSAARGLLESIFWKPEFQWRIRTIKVLHPIQYFGIFRNEILKQTSLNSRTPINIRSNSMRSQRYSLLLRDVGYIIHADVVLNDGIAGVDEAKYRDQFQRRVKAGQFYRTPYLGIREYHAYFGPILGNETVQPITTDLGMMLHGIEYSDDGDKRPIFFRAKLVNGVMMVPQEGEQ